MEKWNYTPEQSKAVKNLKVSNNILKADIKKLNEQLAAGADEATTKAIQDKITYKEGRIATKEAQIAEIQAAAGKVTVTYAKKAAPAAEATPPSEEM